MRKTLRPAGCLACRTNALFDRKTVNKSILPCSVGIAQTLLLVMAVAVVMVAPVVVIVAAATIPQFESSWPRMQPFESITAVWED